MSQPLDYAAPSCRPPSRVVSILAYLTAIYPLLCLGALYLQWLLSWSMLGHRPLLSLDDPKYIAVANWMHPITGLLLLGYLPAACVAIFFNTMYLVRKNSSRAWAIYGSLFILLWAGAFLTLRIDPGHILYWWLD